MKMLVAAFFTWCSCISVQAQKRPIDFATPGNWPLINDSHISNDGRYLFYTIGFLRGNYTKGSEVMDSILIIQDTGKSWSLQIPGRFDDVHFTKDSKRVVGRMLGDSLFIIDLSAGLIRYFSNVKSFKVPESGSGEWIFYQTGDSVNTLVAWNLNDDSKFLFPRENRYYVNEMGGLLVVDKGVELADGQKGIVTEVNFLTSGRSEIISRNLEIRELVFDSLGRRFIFLTGRPGDAKLNSIRYYSQGMDSAIVLVDSNSQGMAGYDLSEGGDLYLTEGRKVFFHVQRKPDTVSDNMTTNKAHVNIWNYKDETLGNFERNNWLLAVVDVRIAGRPRVMQLGLDRDNGMPGSGAACISNNGEYVLMNTNAVGSPNEYATPKTSFPDLCIVSTADGTRRVIKRRLIGSCEGFSRSGKYVVWFDKVRSEWYVYDVSTEANLRIAKDIHASLSYRKDGTGLPAPYGMAGWSNDEKAIFIYDEFEIWKVDPQGIGISQDITKGYGRKSGVQFRLLDLPGQATIDAGKQIIISAFDFQKKTSGFFELNFGVKDILMPLTWNTGYYYYHRSGKNALNGAAKSMRPIGALNAGVFLVNRMKADEYPNLFITDDFKSYKQVTFLEPQKAYNWYTSELIRWKSFDGRKCEGILYKPTNFNSEVKYPVIFCYYESNSSALNFFLHPQLSNGALSIPWFVSNGFVVCTPDIYYDGGYPGKGAYNSVVSAAMYLSRFKWVNKGRMGLQGQSFGAWETYYLLTKTSIFAAAAASSGVSDLVSNYSGYSGSVLSSQSYFESGQGRMGVSPWKRRDLYLENSPIFNADKIKTPLLIMHNKSDQIVPFSEGSSLYADLCRLHKKVWMLSYDDETHTIEDKSDALDYTIRLAQFFDHFLRGKPAPVWMNRGIPRWLKDIQYGLELESSR